MTPQDEALSLAGAIIAVWRDVLGVADLGADSEFGDLCAELPPAVRVVTLLNQLLGTSLSIGQLFTEGTPGRLAAALAAQGVAAPRLSAVPGDGIEPGWRAFWETTYRFANPGRDSGFNTAGWIDTRSLTALPEPHMREWAGATVSRIGQLAPRSVLDVGCGTGLILCQLARQCERYVGVDFAETAVRHVRRVIGTDPGLRHVEVVRADALRGTEAATGRFDLVLLNSVIQYFPDLDYLSAVLVTAAGKLTRGGSVLIGDIRNKNFHQPMHVWLAAAGADDDTPAELVRAAAAQSMAIDSPLLAAPRQMRRVAAAIGPAVTFCPLVRRGTQPTDMNRFRYDVLLSPDAPPVPPADRITRWTARSSMVTLLTAAAGTLVVRGVPDARNFGAVRLAGAIEAAPPGTKLGSIRRALAADPAVPVDPEETWELGHRNGFGVAVAPGDSPGQADIAFWRDHDDRAAASLLAAELWSGAP